jgi:sterol desaturase/sphingolipid hydroxylase (fatty acid hydroxylase superfamily)
MLHRSAAAAVWPVVMAGSLAVAAWGLAAGLPVGPWAFAVSTGNFLLVVALERVLPRAPEADLFRDPQLANDLGHGLLVAGGARPLGGALAAGVVGGLAAAPGVAEARHLWPSGWPFVAQVALGLGLWSFLGYWTHRALHRVAPLWGFHAVHHDAARMHVLKGNRIHWGEDLLRYPVILVPLLLAGAPAAVLLQVALWNNFEGALAHSNVDQRFPRWAHYLLPTPQNHVVHHARARALHDSNFGGVTPLWDLLFGTYRHPWANPVDAVGLEASPVPPGFGSQVLFPLRALRGRR